MNFNHNQPDDFSQPDADLLLHLNTLAEGIEPDALFKAELGAKLHQAHPSKLSQTTSKQYSGHFLRRGNKE